MRLGIAATILAAALVTAACSSPVPLAEHFPPEGQRKAMAVKHWSIVADDMVQQTQSAIGTNKQLQGRPIVVARPPTWTHFDRAFTGFLLTHMVNSGMPVVVCEPKEGAGPGFSEGKPVTVHYEYQVVRHNERFPAYRPEEIVALGLGVAALYGINAGTDVHRDGRVYSGIAAITGLEAYREGRPSPTETELIVTTSITGQNRYVMRRTDVYYVPTADTYLFNEWAAAQTSNAACGASVLPSSTYRIERGV